jgi:radical SAM superfamily enzyme YgiQ (UPF0313 family)
MQCAYCLSANLLRKHSESDAGSVADEVGAAVADAKAHGWVRVPIFFADDEFNLPNERHAIAVLEELERRGLHKSIQWRAYFNPTPFSDELAALIKATNGHASVTVDTAAEEVMVRVRKPFLRPHLDSLVQTLRRHELSADIGLIFGLPGETEKTLAETISFVRSLPPELEVAYSAGARVYPNTPLASIAATEPQWLVRSKHSGDGFFAPIVYSSPFPPRRLARHVGDAFTGLDHVSPVSVGYGSGRTTLSDAYRAVKERDGATAWREVLRSAERPGDPTRTTGEALAAVAQVAAWHGRFDLAARAFRRLVRQSELPAGLSRTKVVLAGLGAAAMAAADRRRLKGADSRVS